jgi:hypothetical protein
MHNKFRNESLNYGKKLGKRHFKKQGERFIKIVRK